MGYRQFLRTSDTSIIRESSGKFNKTKENKLCDDSFIRNYCSNSHHNSHSQSLVILFLIVLPVVLSSADALTLDYSDNKIALLHPQLRWKEQNSLHENVLTGTGSSTNQFHVEKSYEIIEFHSNENSRYLLHLHGSGFGSCPNIKPTFSEYSCDSNLDSFKILSCDERKIILSLDQFDFGEHFRAYLCVALHNTLANEDESSNETEPSYRHLGLASQFDRIFGKSSSLLSEVKSEGIHSSTPDAGLRIEGIRLESSSKDPEFKDNGIPSIRGGTNAVIRLFGRNITEHTVVAFTKEPNVFGGSCEMAATKTFRVKNDSIHDGTALVEVILPVGHNDYYICAKNDDALIKDNYAKAVPLVHQGSDTWLCLSSYQPLLPIWASVIIIVTCLTFSALFSGLNLGLMALDRTELKILRNTGTEEEKKYASKIQPVRDHGNYLLCSILLGNVLVNSTFTILLDGLTSGLIAVIFSTLAIVVFGEITPQAICSRHGLKVGAKTIWITKAVMIITFPLSYPTSKILDILLGEEIGNVYNRERLKELVRVTTGINDLDKDEVNIISGALELRKKTVGDVMTHIEDAFMLSLDAILDFETVSEIMKSGFSRIPVFQDNRQNIVTLLYIKDLAFVDPDDNTPLKTLCEFYQNPCHFVFEDVTLDIMFRQFKEGHKGHMAFVHRVNSEGDGDPFYETIGLVTLEDVIEELIQAEIMDETDVFTDNRTKVKRQRTKKQDFTVFAERRDNQRIRISPQLTLATFQYLSTTVDAFKPDVVSETILRRLLNQDIVHHLKCKGKDKNDPSIIIYQQGKPVDFFVLILEGRVEVTVGKENLVFESGPFTFFGTQALVQNVGLVDTLSQPQQIMGSLQSLNMDAMLRHTFVPDYSVRAVADVVYIAIKRTLYLAAKRATLMERSQKIIGEPGSEPIDDEVEKLLHSLDEDDRSIGAHTVNLNEHTPRNLSKTGSNTPSPTFQSVSTDLSRRKSKTGRRSDTVTLHDKDIVPNGPTPVSPNSLTQMSMSSLQAKSSNPAIPSSSASISPIQRNSAPIVTTTSLEPEDIKGGSVDTPLLPRSKS